MLKTILGLNPLREEDLSAGALSRLRVSAVVGVSVMPIVTLLDKLQIFAQITPLTRLGLALIVVLSLIPIGFSRMNSLFTRPKKNLDEWELSARLSAESFTFRVIGLMLVVMFLAFIVHSFQTDLSAISFQGKDMLNLLGNLVLFCVTLPVAYTAWRQKPLVKEQKG